MNQFLVFRPSCHNREAMLLAMDNTRVRRAPTYLEIWYIPGDVISLGTWRMASQIPWGFHNHGDRGTVPPSPKDRVVGYDPFQMVPDNMAEIHGLQVLPWESNGWNLKLSPIRKGTHLPSTPIKMGSILVFGGGKCVPILPSHLNFGENPLILNHLTWSRDVTSRVWSRWNFAQDI